MIQYNSYNTKIKSIQDACNSQNVSATKIKNIIVTIVTINVTSMWNHEIDTIFNYELRCLQNDNLQRKRSTEFYSFQTVILILQYFQNSSSIINLTMGTSLSKSLSKLRTNGIESCWLKSIHDNTIFTTTNNLVNHLTCVPTKYHAAFTMFWLFKKKWRVII